MRKCKKKVRIVFILSRFREAPGNVAPTPQHAGPRHFGVPLVATQLTDSQQMDVTPAFADKKGNPAKVEDGSIQWMTDNPNLLALTPSADGKTCTVVAVGPLGTATVTMKADADLGAGVSELVGTLEVEVTAGTATVVTLNPGTPTEQPETPPAPNP